MERYTIYCTEEQTKKALELDAPIIDNNPMFCDDGDVSIFIHKNKWGRDEFAYCPTAEQMIGWLEEQGVSCYMYKKIDCPIYTIVRAGSIKERMIWARYYTSRKEATLAAIDAALDYLIKKKK